MLKLISNNFVFFLFLGMALGVVFPNIFSPFKSLLLPLIMFLMFITCVRLDFDEFFSQLKRIKFYFLLVLLSMLIIPAIVYLVTSAIFPTLALAGMVLVALPSGVNAMLFADLFKGNKSIGLILTMLTQLVCPITIPLLVWFFIGQNLDISYFDLFMRLLEIIIVPLIFSYFAQKSFKKQISNYSQHLRVSAILFTTFLLAVILASYVNELYAQIDLLVPGFIYSIILFFGLLFVGFKIGSKYSKPDKIAIGVGFAHLNLALGLVITSLYFPIEVFLLMVISEFTMTFWKLVFNPLMKIIN